MSFEQHIFEAETLDFLVKELTASVDFTYRQHN